jgi:prevent-host-death family protein
MSVSSANRIASFQGMPVIESIAEDEVRRRFSELLNLVEMGHEISITRRGVPVARIVPAHVGVCEQAAQVRSAFAELSSLCARLELEGDLKQIARRGLA